MIQYPIANKKPHAVKFGNISLDRGENLLSPPREIIDNYYWMRDDKRGNKEVLDHLNKENKYF